MDGQAPNQDGTTSATPSNSGGPADVILDDPIFSNVHNAFQLGWSLIELKSRIQIKALSTSITGTPEAESTSGPSNSSQAQADPSLQKMLATVDAAKTKLLVPESQQNLTDLPD